MIIKSLSVHSKEDNANNIEETYAKYSNMIFRVCFSYMKNTADAEDVVADVFVNLIKSGTKFQSDEHEKAWFLRTAINLCKNNLKRRRKNIDECKNLPSESETENPFEINDILSSVMELPERYKSVIYLYYYEGYSTSEIAKILKKTHSSVRVHLHEARKILKGVLESENEK